MPQLSLWVDPAGEPARPRAGAALLTRLQALGLPRFDRLATHRNRQVMVSWRPGHWFRVHEGYAAADDAVLAAIVRFATPGIRRPVRLEARRIFLAFPADRHAPPPPAPRGERRPSPLTGDGPLLARLQAAHAELNAAHFGGRLGSVRIRLSARMRRRLGEIRLDRLSRRPLEIALSRRHVRRDGWTETCHTLLHEMVHQWQAETGQPVDHGAGFRAKALEVGIEPRAVRREEPEMVASAYALSRFTAAARER